MNYFAYGSNMALTRLLKRVPAARYVGICVLKNHSLRFHKVGQDGSAKCDAYFTGSNNDVVEGVVFDLDARGVELLDKVEGLGRGYEKKTVRVSHYNGDMLEAFIYIATNIDDSIFPFTWYKNHVLVGAMAARLSLDYQGKIERIKAIKDSDIEREQRELEIHM